MRDVWWTGEGKLMTLGDDTEVYMWDIGQKQCSIQFETCSHTFSEFCFWPKHQTGQSIQFRPKAEL